VLDFVKLTQGVPKRNRAGNQVVGKGLAKKVELEALNSVADSSFSDNAISQHSYDALMDELIKIAPSLLGTRDAVLKSPDYFPGVSNLQDMILAKSGNSETF
jgi:hypothetical protein